MRKIKNLFPVIIICILLLSGYTQSVEAASNTKLYNDINSTHWAYKSISKMKDLKIMGEVSNGKFYPEQSITRAQAVQYLFNALKVKKTAKTNFLFKDVPQNATYKDALYTLTSLGVIYDTEKFNPNSHLTRAELTKILSVAFKIEVDNKNRTTFRDVSSSHWAKDYIGTLGDINIVKGTSTNYFSPNQTVTRAQMATFLDRILTFQKQVASNEMIYDYLQRGYISTINPYPTWTTKVIELVNAERKKQGLSVLQADSKLTQLAVIKGNDMILRKYFEHLSPFYGYAWDMAGVFDYSFTSIGENLARNSTSPEAVVQAWMKSTSHKNNMMNTSYTNIGVACVKGKDGQLYWVQLFSKK